MKIIAKVNDSRFLVEAEADELAQVMGFSGYYYLKDGNKLAVGKVVNVSPLYRALEVSRGRKAEIAALAEQLRKTAGRVDTINQALAEPIVEVEVEGK